MLKLSLSPLILLLLIAGGCGSGDQVAGSGPDPKVEKQQVQDMIALRKLFEQSGGDYTKLSTTDKTEANRLAGGSQAQAEQLFAQMKAGPTDVSSSEPK